MKSLFAHRAFRVLFIDDDLDLRWSPSHPQTNAWDNRLLHAVQDAAKGTTSPIEIWAAQDCRGTFHKLSPEPKTFSGPPRSFLENFDIVVLDLLGLKLESDFPPLTRSEVDHVTAAFDTRSPKFSEAELQHLTAEVGGVAFFYRHFAQLRQCQAVIFVTAQDKSSSFSGVAELVDGICRSHPSSEFLPYVTKFSKGMNVMDAARTLQNLVTAGADGTTYLTNRGAIEFAASTNFSALIVGETGTGKEHLARDIHRGWVRWHGRETAPPFVTVNCAALEATQARGELFGHVAGALPGVVGPGLGAVLRACGCTNLTAVVAEKEASLRAAALQLRKALQRPLEFRRTDDVSKLAAQMHEFVQLLNALFAPDNTHQSLPEVLLRTERHLTEVVEGRDSSARFRDHLLDQHSDLFELDPQGGPFDLRYKQAKFVGTLFLDEFGCLPIPVQAMLLRFLDTEIAEIQPAGYTGVIRGLKVRIIAATNNPAIAALAGVKLNGRVRNQDHADSPVLEDLVHRVRQIVIRAEPVTVTNAQSTIRRMVTPRRWSEKAIKEIVTHVGKHANSPTFGHRRELQRIISLVETFVETAEARGFRRGTGKQQESGDPLQISIADVRPFLAPALELAPGKLPAKADAQPSPDDSAFGDPEAEKIIFGQQTHLLTVLRHYDANFADDFTWSDVRDLVAAKKSVAQKLKEWDREMKKRKFRQYYSSIFRGGPNNESITSTIRGARW